MDSIKYRFSKYADVIIGMRKICISNLQEITQELTTGLAEFGKRDVDIFVADLKYNVYIQHYDSYEVYKLLEKEYSTEILNFIKAYKN